MTTSSQERVATLVSALMSAVRDVIVDQRVSYPEYNAAKDYLAEVGAAGEWPLFGDVFFEAAVEQVACLDSQASDSTILGPYFIPDSPLLSRPCVLPMRPDEPGQALVLSGTVHDSDGEPLEGAVIDMWQCDASGTYSGIPYGDDREIPPPGNLRGRVPTDADGSFQVRTIVPVPYEIPKSGPTGQLLAAAGWHAFRPAHLHCIVTAPGYEPLTVQLYLRDDPYLDSDVASAVKPGLVLELRKRDDGDGDVLDAEHHFRLVRA